MKKLFILLLIICTTNLLKAQDTTNFIYKDGKIISEASLFKNDTLETRNQIKPLSPLMHKAKRQITTGKILLAAGTGIVLADFAIALSNFKIDISFYPNERSAKRYDNTGAVVAIIGAAIAVSGVPFLILGHSTKKKAKLLIKDEPISLTPYPKNNQKMMVVGIKLSF